MLDATVAEGTLKEEINKLYLRKITSGELELEQRIDIINSFIEQELQCTENYCRSITHKSVDPTERLDQLFRNTLLEAWPM